MKTIDEKEKFIELRAEGNSFDKISEVLNISKPTLINWNNELHTEINNLEYLKYQAILEKFKLVKKKKIEFLAEQLNKINKVIKSRSYDILPTKELILLRRELNSELIEEINGKKYKTGIFETSELDIPGFSSVETTFELE